MKRQMCIVFIYYSKIDTHYVQVSLVVKYINGLSLSVKVATLIFISGRGSAILSAKEGKSGFVYNLVKS